MKHEPSLPIIIYCKKKKKHYTVETATEAKYFGQKENV